MIAEALSSNSIIKRISLSHNDFEPADVGEVFATYLKTNKTTLLEELHGVDLFPFLSILGLEEDEGVSEEARLSQTYDEEGNPTNVRILSALRHLHDLHI